MAEMTMVERVARALCLQEGEDPNQETPYHPKVTHLWQHYVPSARAAIEAMREPTREMLAVGKRSSCADDIYLTVDEVSAIYSAMVEAALNEEVAG